MKGSTMKVIVYTAALAFLVLCIAWSVAEGSDGVWYVCEPPAGWHLLDPDDITKDGDMILTLGDGWNPLKHSWEIGARVFDFTRPIARKNPVKLREKECYYDTLLSARSDVREVNEVKEEFADTGSWVCDPPPAGSNSTYLIGYGHFEKDPNTKIVTTTHVRIKTLTFKWSGKERKVEDREVLWMETQTFKLKKEWKKFGPPERNTSLSFDFPDVNCCTIIQ
jgi:hypothetical protein